MLFLLGKGLCQAEQDSRAPQGRDHPPTTRVPKACCEFCPFTISVLLKSMKFMLWCQPWDRYALEL